MVPTHPWPLAITGNELEWTDYINTCQPFGLTHQGQPRKALLKVLVTCIALGAFALPEKIELLL